MVDEVTKYAEERFSCAPLFIDDTTDLKIEDFLCKAKKMVNAKGIQLIIIDYVQFMCGPVFFGQMDRERKKWIVSPKV